MSGCVSLSYIICKRETTFCGRKKSLRDCQTLRKWRHLLIGRRFTSITDQKSLLFMFDTRHSSKIKNEKVLRWRLELSCLSYTVIHRPGRDNVESHTSRGFCGSINNNSLTTCAICMTRFATLEYRAWLISYDRKIFLTRSVIYNNLQTN